MSTLWIAIALLIVGAIVVVGGLLVSAVMRDSGRCVHCDRLYPLAALPTHEDRCMGSRRGR